MSSGGKNSSPLQRVVLVGFMGSGKTTVGHLLAAKLGWTFVDLDEAIEIAQRSSVPRIFAEHGEEAFRQAEVEALRGLVPHPKLVIALGGGAPETSQIRQLLSSAEDTAVVHLHAPFSQLYERCTAQALDPNATARPLLGAREPAAERYHRRLPFYAEIARFRANAAADPGIVAEEIFRTLKADL